MIKYLILILALTISFNVNAKSTTKEEIMRDYLYSSYCQNKRHIKNLLNKSLATNATENFKGKDDKKYQAYLKGTKEKTRMYQIQAVKYKGYNRTHIHCAVIFSLKPNKQQKELDNFYAEFYINIELILKENTL